MIQFNRRQAVEYIVSKAGLVMELAFMTDRELLDYYKKIRYGTKENK